MIRHDASDFGRLDPADGHVLDVVEFVDRHEPTRRVTALYADKEAEEQVTGADLVYFRETLSGSSVQYKRMRQEGAEPDSPYGYRPETAAQGTSRMRAILATIPQGKLVQHSDRSSGGSTTNRLHQASAGRTRPPLRGDLIQACTSR